MTYEIINPEELGAPSGWNNGMLAPAGGQVLFIAGQVACDASGTVAAAGFVEQFGLALDNVLHVVRQAGGRPEHIGRMLLFVTDVAAYRESLKELGVVWRERMGRFYPAMALLQVRGLLDEEALVEIEATAVIPPEERLQEDRIQPVPA